jgi:hypothetical protein
MKSIRFTINTLTTTIFIFTLAVSAQSQSRVFVSGLGDDLNLCTRTSPCRNFQRGHDVVAPGGEVVALDSAGYGSVTITKSITITGDAVYAGITAGSGNGVTIATAGITVTLRSLIINGLGSGTSGISATEFTVLHIENVIMSGFGGSGIFVEPSAAGTRKVFIKDSISRNNGAGIYLSNTSGTALIGTIDGTRAENNTFQGIFINAAGASVTARGCLSSGNSAQGFYSQVSAVLNIESSVASNNGTLGISTSNSGTVRVSNSTVTNNAGFGFLNDTGFPGTFESRQNNTVAGNNGGGAQTDGTITPLVAL